MEEELDHLLDVDLVVLLAEGNEGHDEGGLHFGFVEQLLFAASFPKLVEDEGAGDRAEDEHVEEDVEDEHAVVPGILLDSRQLVVGVAVVGPQDVGDEDHPVQLPVVALIVVQRHAVRHHDQLLHQHREEHHDRPVEDEQQNYVLPRRK
jgi:hypothetical protein